MRRIWVVIVAGALTIFGAPSARAHAFLDHASPAVGSSVPAAPAVVTLWFTQDLEPAFSDVTVTNEAGQRVDLGNAHIPQGSPAELQIGLKPLPPGTYLVSWHVVSVDTHPTEGTFTFEVGRGWASVRSQIVAELLIVSRLVQFAAVIVVFGCAAFRIYGLGVDSTMASASALIIFDAWFWRVTTVGAIVALLSALSLILGVTANMAGSAAAALDPDTISKVLFDTSFGGCGAGISCLPSSQSGFALRRGRVGGCRRSSSSPSCCWSA